MRLATVRTGHGTRAARLDGEQLVLLPYGDVVELLRQEDWLQAASQDGETRPRAGADLAPVVRPGKTLCVGLNYKSHIMEMGRPLPEHPTLFAKYPEVLVGAEDDVVLPSVSSEVDWEAELGVVIGSDARSVAPDQALQHVAGYTVVNDVSMRDWQWRTTQWMAGKNFEATTPVGPYLVTPDEVDHALDLAVTCEVDGTVMQSARTSDLLFPVADVISYVSQFITLRPGDLLAMGTPGGVASARADKPFLRDGQVVRVTVEGLGSCVNTFRAVAA